MGTIRGFARPRGVWNNEGWSPWGRKRWQARRLGQLGSLIHSNRNRVLPRLGSSRSQGIVPLGVTAPRRMLGGCSRSQNHEWLCPDFAPSAIAGAGLPLPSTPLPSPRLHLSPSQRRYPGWLRRKRGAEPALLFVRAATGKSSSISTRTAGDVHLFIQAGQP